MRKLLLASHGPLARAMRETLQLFCGEDPRVKVLCAYVDEDTMDVNELIDFGSVRPNLTRSAVRRTGK